MAAQVSGPKRTAKAHSTKASPHPPKKKAARPHGQRTRTGSSAEPTAVAQKIAKGLEQPESTAQEIGGKIGKKISENPIASETTRKAKELDGIVKENTQPVINQGVNTAQDLGQKATEIPVIGGA